MELKDTPLKEEHLKLNALMSEFAGWFLPIHYGSVIEEAKHTRAKVSVFDIFHMGKFIVRENPDKSSLDSIITVPVTKMKTGKCKYGFLLNDSGTVIDDLIVFRIKEDEWMIVVNASNEEKDAKIISSKLSKSASFENISSKTAKLDVQGPLSSEIVSKIAGDKIKELKYFSCSVFNFFGGDYIISRTGYTGELGFEIYIDKDKVIELWKELLKFNECKPAGLGARDILRLEMGYPLYGDELTEDITPLEAGFERVLDFEKDFTGKQALLKQKKEGIRKTLIGIECNDRRQPRHLNKIFKNGKEIGFVTSGVFSPHLNRGIGMGYIFTDSAKAEDEINIVSEKGEISGKIAELPFLKETSLKYVC
ncbi:MAG: glycine cleavage system aminomethyltransferase GcvT [Candidatus Goldbacteria bacterium]|nr:glycine cleavage system aminomethyltransferase GcvT [Candidatus Goldiibacteriota bacterium]